MSKLFVERFVTRDGRIRAVWSDGTETGPPIMGSAPDDEPAEEKPPENPPPVDPPVEEKPAGLTAENATLEAIEAMPTAEWFAIPEEQRTAITAAAKERAHNPPPAEEPKPEEPAPEPKAEEPAPEEPKPEEPKPEETKKERTLQEIVADVRNGVDVPMSEYRRLEDAQKQARDAADAEDKQAKELEEYFPALTKRMVDTVADVLELDITKMDKQTTIALNAKVKELVDEVTDKASDAIGKPLLRELREVAITALGGSEAARASIMTRPPREWATHLVNSGRVMGRAEVTGQGQKATEEAVAAAKKEWEADRQKAIDDAVKEALRKEREAHPERSFQHEEATPPSNPYANETVADIERIPYSQWMSLPKETRDARLAAAKERDRRTVAGAR